MKVKDPVEWAFGANFIFGLKNYLLFTLFPDRVDARGWMAPSLISAGHPERSDPASDTTDFWFDFVADTGDASAATYSTAYLLHGDLSVIDGHGAVERDDPSAARGCEVVARVEAGTPHAALTRGAFLLVGGDTAYSVADERTIRERFVAPFDHAHAQRFAGATPAPAARPLLGIPGNHDWYDGLDGFNRLYRRAAEGGNRAIAPRGFRSVQEASYFALELPDGSQLWAIDGRGEARIDSRQRAFFRAQAKDVPVVLVTPVPPVSSGERAPFVDELLSQLNLGKERVRLWIAGDDHHYARYRGLAADDRALPSVVCGLGGASLTIPVAGRIPAQAVHPDPGVARASVSRRLRSPLFMLRRTHLWIVGALLGWVLGAGLRLPHGEAASLARWFGIPGVAAHAAHQPFRPSALLALLDLGFYVMAGACLAVLPAFAASGAARSRIAPWTRAVLFLLGLLAGAAILAGGVAGSVAATSLVSPTSPALGVAIGGLGAALVDAMLLPCSLGMALAAALQMGAHVGSASAFAMIDEHQAFIRFRLRAGRDGALLTGFVVAVTRTVTAETLRNGQADAGDLVPRARLIDVFTVRLRDQ